MKRLLLCLAVVAIGAAAIFMYYSQSAARAAGERDRAARARQHHEKEQKLTMEKLPPKVRAAVRKLAKRNEIKEIERSVRKCYEAEWRQGKNEVEVLVTASGRLVGKEVEKAGEEEEEEEAEEDEKQEKEEAEEEEGEEEEEHEVEISLGKLPPKAKAAILKLAGKNKIQEVEEVRVAFYEAEWVQGENEVEVLLTRSGRVIHKEVEREGGEEAEEEEEEEEEEAEEGEEEEEEEAEEQEEEEEEEEEDEHEHEHEHEHAREVKVSLDQVPAKVRATLKKAAGDRRLKELEQITATLFEAEWVQGKREVEILVTPNGKVLKREVEKAEEEEEEAEEEEKEEKEEKGEREEEEEHETAISLDKLPSKAKAAIRKAAGRNEIKEVERVTMKLYEAEWKQGDREVEILVASNGKVLKRSMEKKKEDEDEDEDEK